MPNRKMILGTFQNLFPLFFALVVSIAFAGCGGGLGFSRATPTPLAFLQADSNNNLESNVAATQAPLAGSNRPLYVVERREIAHYEEFSGSVVLSRAEDLSFARNGYIDTVFVENGALVTAGTPLVSLDSEIFQLDLESALLSQEIAEQRLVTAEGKLTYERQAAQIRLELAQQRMAEMQAREVEDPGSVTPFSFRMQELQVQLTQLALDNIADEVDPALILGLERVKLDVEKLKGFVLDTRITAPFDGEVRFFSLVDETSQGTIRAFEPIARIVDPSSMLVELSIVSSQMQSLQEGMEVKVHLISQDDTTVSGVISSLPGPFGTGTSPRAQVTLLDSEANSLLREGNSVSVEVALESKPDVLVVPQQAVFTENNAHYVVLQDNGQEREVPVVVGIANGRYVEIVSGLSEGQVVVERGL